MGKVEERANTHISVHKRCGRHNLRVLVKRPIPLLEEVRTHSINRHSPSQAQHIDRPAGLGSLSQPVHEPIYNTKQRLLPVTDRRRREKRRHGLGSTHALGKVNVEKIVLCQSMSNLRVHWGRGEPAAR
jgi:hypothetical protein